jgi:hypothetical protein
MDQLIHRHDIIPLRHLEDIRIKFVAIDNALSLYFTNHHVSPLLTKILDSASSLANMRIKISDIEHILYLDSRLYHVYKLNGGAYDFTQIYIKFPASFSNGQIHHRRTEFVQTMNSWIDENKLAQFVPSVEIQLLLVDRAGSPSKIVKRSISPTKRVSAEMKNSPSKFQFKERRELTEQKKNNGLSLIERIKLKEQQAAALKKDPKQSYKEYLQGKSKTIYEIIHQSVPNDNTVTSFSMAKLCEIIKDSTSYPPSTQEVVDIIKHICEKLQRGTFTIVERNGITILKVRNLNRGQDLKLLQSA